MPETLDSIRSLRESWRRAGAPKNALTLLDNYENLLKVQVGMEASGGPGPDDLLQELRDTLDQLDVMIEAVKGTISGAPPGSPLIDALTNFINGIIREIVPALTSLAAERLGVPAQTLARKVPSVTISHHPDVNAGIAIGPSESKIELYSGLVVFLMEMGKLYMGIGDLVERNPSGLPRVRLKEAGDRVRTLLRLFWVEERTSKATGEFEDLGPGQAERAHAVFLAAMSQAFGHELGHLILAEAPGSARELVAAQAQMKALPEVKPPFAEGTSWRSKWAVELACDAIGLDLAESLWKARDRTGIGLDPGGVALSPGASTDAISRAYAGLTMFFDGLDLVEQYGLAKGRAEVPASSHPPAVLRRASLLTLVSETRGAETAARVDAYARTVREAAGTIGIHVLSKAEFLKEHFR